MSILRANLGTGTRRRARKELPRWRFSGAAALFALVLALLLYSVYGLRQTGGLSEGEPSPQTYRAPRELEVVDPIATERARGFARTQIGPIYASSPALQRLVIGAVSTSGLPQEVQRFLIRAYNRPGGVSERTLPGLIGNAAARAPEARRREVEAVLGRLLLATAQPDVRLTEAAREAAAASVEPALQVLAAGEVIVRRGERLSADTLRALEAAGLYNPRTDVLSQSALVALACAALALLLALPLLYLYAALKRTLSLGQIAFLTLLWTVGLIAQRLALLADPNLLFIAFLPLLGAVLTGERLAFVLAVWLSVITALFVPGGGFITLLVTLSGGVVTTALARVSKSRASLLFAGLLGGLVAALGFALYSALAGGFGTLAMLTSLAWIAGGGAIAGILALAALPLAESNMGFLTEFRLLELMSPSNPLLQKLLLEAPGSYQHSLIISNLVEQAVTNIGGNALLARVGALYHDVGKLRRPQFFTENQFAGENPHDHISPHLSYLIITSHVRDGVELLREYGLPAALEPFVAEHHGTTVLSYFYKRALEKSDKVNELNFRYAGPRPQTRETAVLMLADTVESASRTLSEPSQGSIRAMIDRLIEQRLQDDQLAESPLNFRDLEVIATTFERMLTAILHRRVSYPSQEEIARLKHGRDPRRHAAFPLP